MRAFRRRAAIALFVSVSALHAQSPATTNVPASIAPLIPQLEDYVVKGMQKTGVPGVAVGIVYQDKVVYLKGFGVRKAGEPAPVDTDTVFQPASVSKAIFVDGRCGVYEDGSVRRGGCLVRRMFGD